MSTTSGPTVAMVIDSSPAAGLGHLARCRSLATELRRRDIATRAVLDAELTATVRPWGGAFDAVDVADTGGRFDLVAGADAVVLDSYTIGLDTLPPGIRRVAIDDGPGRPLDADLVVNPNLGATADGYRVRIGGAVLAGSAFALLAPETRQAVAVRSISPSRRVLVTCGAADPVAMTERYLDALGLLEEPCEVRVVIGPGNERHRAIADRSEREGHHVVTGATGLVAHELWADIALTTLGTTAAELACLGVPNLSVAIDARQLPHLAAYERLGVVIGLGWHADAEPARIATEVSALLADSGRRATLRDKAMAVVDGKGAVRVADSVIELLEMPR